MLIAARVVQAVGGAALIPASLGLVLAEVPAQKRAIATSVWAAAGAVAAATGPSLGGVLVETTSWRWAFFVNLVIVIAIQPAARLLRETRESDSNRTPDLLGTAMLVVAIGALALGIVKAPDWGWTSDRVLAAWSIAAAFAALLVARSARHPAPVLEPAMLRIRTFSTANAAFFLFSIGFYALLLGNILFLTQVWRYSLLEAGFAVTPGGADGRDCGRGRRAAGRAVRIPPGGRAGAVAVLRRVPRLPRRRAATGLPRSLAAHAARLGQRGRVDIRGTDQRVRR